jgi:hypothetical protein
MRTKGKIFPRHVYLRDPNLTEPAELVIVLNNGKQLTVQLSEMSLERVAYESMGIFFSRRTKRRVMWNHEFHRPELL